MAVETPGTTTQPKSKIGVVVSDKMHKTVVVAVDNFRRHPLYGRSIRKTRRFKAHDEENACHVGDQVEITECRPLSKEKHWIVTRVLRQATAPARVDVDSTAEPASGGDAEEAAR